MYLPIFHFLTPVFLTLDLSHYLSNMNNLPSWWKNNHSFFNAFIPLLFPVPLFYFLTCSFISFLFFLRIFMLSTFSVRVLLVSSGILVFVSCFLGFPRDSFIESEPCISSHSRPVIVQETCWCGDKMLEGEEVFYNPVISLSLLVGLCPFSVTFVSVSQIFFSLYGKRRGSWSCIFPFPHIG